MKRFLIAAIAGFGLVACGGTPTGTPGFTVLLAPNTATIIQGKSVSTTVNVVRTDGFNDAINVTVSAQTGLSAQALTIAAGSSSGTLTLNSTALLTQTSSPLSLTVTGKGGSLPDQTAVLSLTVRGAPGAADTTFGSNGVLRNGVLLDYSKARLLPDGKLVAVGINGTGKVQVNRFNADGSADTSFGTAGASEINFLNNNSKLCLQPDGKIIVGSPIFNFSGAGSFDIGLTRLNSNGSLDTGFGTAGKQLLDFGGDDSSPGQIVFANNKILVAGRALIVAGVVANDFALARFNLDGSPDTSFDTDGKLVLNMGGNDFADAVAVQPDGKIVLAGISDSGISPNVDLLFSSTRVNDDGTLDITYGDFGKQERKVSLRNASFSGGYELKSLTILNDGRIVLSGNASDPVSSTQKFVVLRLLPSGLPDTTFADAGLLVVGEGRAGDFGGYTLIQADAQMLIVGDSRGVYTATGTQVYMVRLNPNGTLDASFGNGGKSYVTANTQGVFDTRLLADGKIEVLSRGYDATQTKYFWYITRYWP
jgi:uncharacterized delta-60 repeat protein